MVQKRIVIAAAAVVLTLGLGVGIASAQFFGTDGETSSLHGAAAKKAGVPTPPAAPHPVFQTDGEKTVKSGGPETVDIVIQHGSAPVSSDITKFVGPLGDVGVTIAKAVAPFQAFGSFEKTYKEGDACPCCGNKLSKDEAKRLNDQQSHMKMEFKKLQGFKMDLKDIEVIRKSVEAAKEKAMRAGVESKTAAAEARRAAAAEQGSKLEILQRVRAMAGRGSLTPGDGHRLLGSLTADQKKLMKDRGYLKPSDLTAEQKSLFPLPTSGHFVFTMADETGSVTIKSEDSAN